MLTCADRNVVSDPEFDRAAVAAVAVVVDVESEAAAEVDDDAL